MALTPWSLYFFVRDGPSPPVGVIFKRSGMIQVKLSVCEGRMCYRPTTTASWLDE